MTQEQPEPPCRGRFAPTPNGPLHLGSLLAAVGSWLFARHAGGRWLVRVEDLDPPREVPGAAAGQLATLARFGLVPDEPVLAQSTRGGAYLQALEQLRRADAAYPCWCSRKDLAPLGGRHPHRCIAPPGGDAPAWRVRVDARVVAFDDRVRGPQRFRLDAVEGDFVVFRRDGLAAYQLAVVVDDHAQGITEVVRGSDLLDSTPRQIHLQRLLGLPTPAYAHLPLLMDASGAKLGKSTGAAALDRAPPAATLRQVLRLLGLDAARLPATDCPGTLLTAAARAFDPADVPRHDLDWPVMDDTVAS